MEVAHHENMRGGKGVVQITELLGKKIPHIRFLKEVLLVPGASIGVHPHHEEAEAYIILEGEATVIDGDESITLYAGDAHLCSDGEEHGIMNQSNQNMRMLAVIATLAE